MSSIDNCKRVLLVFSEHSCVSSYVEHEIKRAYSKSKTIISYRLSRVEMKWWVDLFLYGIYWVEHVPNDNSFERLVAAVKYALGMYKERTTPNTVEEQKRRKLLLWSPRKIKSKEQKNGRRIDMAHDVFISHSAKDKLTADAICHALEHNGISCWIAPRDVRAGFDYGEEIISGIDNCKLMVLIFSEHSNNAPFVKSEIERAFSKNKIIIPYRLSQVEMSRGLELFLAGKHWINAYPNDTVFENLIIAVKKALGMDVGTIVREEDDDSGKRTDKKAGKDKKERTPFTKKAKAILVGVASLIIVVGLVFGGMALWGNHGGSEEPGGTEDGGSVSTNAPSVSDNGENNSSEITTPRVNTVGLSSVENSQLNDVEYAAIYNL